MATKETEAPTVSPGFEGNIYDQDDVYVDGPGYPSRELTAEEVVARKVWLERQEAQARGEDRLTEHEMHQRRLHPIERYTMHSDARGSEVLVVNHTTGTAVIERKFVGANRGGQRSVTGDLTVSIPVESWSFEETGRVKL